MSVMADVYSSRRRVIVSRYVSELKFVERADVLTRNLTFLRKQSAALAQKLNDLSGHVEEQVEELYRTEVDLDMKLRTCRGTCRVALPFSADHHGFESLQTDLKVTAQRVRQKHEAAAPPMKTPQIKLQPSDVGPVPSVEYRTIPAVRTELLNLFEDVGVNQLVLELNESAELHTLSSAEPET
ncbi:fibrinogen alpha chain [Kryptolebias marmoratus]|nr:fibrinogen alpha chain [Kryptolebias marmoratus]